MANKKKTTTQATEDVSLASVVSVENTEETTTQSTQTSEGDASISQTTTPVVGPAPIGATSSSIGVDPYVEPPEKAMFLTADSLRTYTEQLKALVFDAIMPVGFLYISLDGNHPTYGTWQDVSATYNYRSFWVLSTVAAGTQLNGSLPNITGQINSLLIDDGGDYSQSGALYQNGIPRTRSWSGSDGSAVRAIAFQASRSNSIYSGAAGSNIVRPTCVTVHVFKRTA